MSTNPADIARALSEAQRDWLFAYEATLEEQAITAAQWDELPELWVGEWPDYEPLNGHWLGSATAAKSAGTTQWSFSFKYNELGLAVRDYLLHRPTIDASTDRNQATVDGCGKEIE